MRAIAWLVCVISIIVAVGASYNDRASNLPRVRRLDVPGHVHAPGRHTSGVSLT